VHLVVVVVGTDRVVVVVVVVVGFGCWVVVVVLVVDDLVVVEDFVVLVEVDEGGAWDEVASATVWAWTGGGACERGVPSVATCSSRTGGWPSGRCWLVTPAAKIATTAAPRNAPTAMRNGAPCWSSTTLVVSA
jgi:hypothetical protein